MTTLRVALASVVLLAACAGTTADDDPTSMAALRKGPTFAYGSTCTRVEKSWFGTSRNVTRTPLCLDQADCGSGGGSSGTAYAGGLEWYGSTTFENVKWFEGTCEKARAITCDSRTAADGCSACSYAKCCVQTALCEDDPNCIATAACFTTCGADVNCAKRCAANSDSEAYEHFYAAVQCTSTNCADECAQ